MKSINRALRLINDDEQGHAEVGVPTVAAGIGAVMLGVGAGGGGDTLAIIGGVVLGVGFVAASLLRHRLIDYDLWTRLDKLEK